MRVILIYPNLVAKRFIISIKVKGDSIRLAGEKKSNGKIYCFFGIAALIPLVFSFQNASHTPAPLQATHAQFTYTANTSCMPWKNDKLPTESTYLL